MIHGLGLVDDFANLRAPFKFVLQVVAAALVTAGGFTIANIWVPIVGGVRLGLFAFPATVIWIVGISNAMNFMDGIDGLAGGIAVFSALSLGIMMLLQGRAEPALVAFTLLGAVLGFLFFNLPPARIFMGDSGSLLLGFILAVIPLLGAPGGTAPREMLAPLTILTIPIFDMAAAIGRRLREKRKIHSPDKEHIHHKLLAIGMRDTRVILLLYCCCAYFGAAAIASISLPRTASDLLLAVVWVGSLCGYWWLHRRARRQRIGIEGGRP
jgi:UDP-GlcNAc:undecaprenyl-phosphate GlcNAc-1-phosphate transferase